MIQGIVRGFAAIFSLGCIAVIALHLALPSIVRRQLADVLARAGYERNSFTVTDATMWGARIEDLRAGANNELAIDFAEIGFEPQKIVFGRIEALTIKHAAFSVDLDPILRFPATSPSTDGEAPDLWESAGTTRLPLWLVQFENCSIIFKRHNAKAATMQINGFLWREGLPADRTRISIRGTLQAEPNPTRVSPQTASPAEIHDLLAVDGTIHFVDRWVSITCSLERFGLDSILPLLPDLAEKYVVEAQGRAEAKSSFYYAAGAMQQSTLSAEVSGERIVGGPALGSATFAHAHAALALESLLPPRAPGEQTISIKAIDFDGKSNLSNVKLSFSSRDANKMVISRAMFDWAGGHVRATRAATVDAQQGQADFAMEIDGIGLAEFASLVSGGSATGEGKLSGHVDASIAWPSVRFRSGQLKSDGGGLINFGSKVGGMATSIAQRDARLHGQGDQIMEALSNFEYSQLLFDVERNSDGTLRVATHVNGRGRQGLTTPIDLTINYSGDLEEALNAYLKSSFGSRDLGR